MAHAEVPDDGAGAGKKPRAPRRDAVRRRREIVDAARQVFAERGLNGARTREIAQAAGVTEGVMYRYFSSKQDLFEAAIIEPLEELVEQLIPLEEAVSSAASPEEREASIHFLERRWMTAMAEIVPLLGVALFSDRENGRRFYQERIYPLIARSIEVAPSSLTGWAREDVDPTVLIYTIFGVHFVLALDRHFRDGSTDLESFVPRIADQIVFGVMPFPPGAK